MSVSDVSIADHSGLHQQLKDALDQHALVSIADARGKIKFVNDKFVDISGYSREELLGQDHRILKSGEHPPEFYRSIWKTIASGRVWQGTLCNRAKGGDLYWVESTISPFFNAEGQITEYVSIRTDVSALMRVRQEQIKEREELAKAVEIASNALKNLHAADRKKNQIYGTVAHELRTPVSAIKMMCEVSNDEFLQYRGDILIAVNDLIHTIDDMRMLVNPDLKRPLRLETVALEELNRQIRNVIAAPVAAASMKFEDISALPIKMPYVEFRTDIYRMKVAVSNLIKNAALHSLGTSIWMMNSIYFDADGKHWLQWIVGDDGVGIDKEIYDTLVQPFARGQSKSEGTGLGLYIVKTWIEELGGSLSYRRLSQGSEFTLSLPIFNDALSSNLNSSQDEAASSDDQIPAGLKVLLVEDDRMLRMLQEKLLTKLGVEVETAEDGVIGLSKIDSGYDLVLTDYFMPNMNGVQMIRAAREQQVSIPIVGLTAATIGNQRQELLDAGALFVLPKPLTKERFKEAVSNLTTQGHLKIGNRVKQ